MPIIEGTEKRIVEPLKDNDPSTLLEGQAGTELVSSGGFRWFRPIADNIGDPVPAPRRLGEIDGSLNAVGEVPVGAIDGVNKVYTVSSEILNQSGSVLTLDGVKAKPVTDYTTSGTTITFVDAPAVGTELYIVYGLILGGGVSSFNGRGGVVLPASGDYTADQITPAENVITVSPTNGDFATVGAALASIIDSGPLVRYAILVGPGIYEESNPVQGKAYVSIVGIGDLQTVRLVASVADQDLFQEADFFTVENVTLCCVTGADKYAVRHDVAGECKLTNVGFLDCSNGVILDHASASITVDGATFTNPPPGTVTTIDGFLISEGNAVLNLVRAPVGSITTLIRSTGSGSFMTIRDLGAFNSSLTTGVSMADSSGASIIGMELRGCTDGVVVSGGVVVKIVASNILDCTNDGIRVDDVGTGTDLIVHSMNVDGSARYDINLLSSSCVLSGSGQFSIDQMNKVADAQIYMTVVDLKEGDEGTNILGELHVGLPEEGAESVFGEGDSYTRGMLVYTESSGGAFVDISEDAKSASGSTFTFADNAVGSRLWITSSVLKPSVATPLKHYGIKALLDSTGVSDPGDIKVFYTNFGLQEVSAFEADSSGRYFPHANGLFNNETSVHVRYDPELPVLPWTQTDPGGLQLQTYYWICIELQNTVTTLPVFQQFKLHSNRLEINSDGWIEYFGSARPVAQLPFAIGQDQALSGNLGNQSLWINGNTGSGLDENNFTTVGDTIGRTFFLPQDLDTSGKIKLKIVGRPSASGTVALKTSLSAITDTDVIYTSDPGALPGLTTQTVSQTVVATQATFYDFELDVSSLVARRENGQPDVVSLSIEATVLTGQFAMFALEADYTKWCEGGHV